MWFPEFLAAARPAGRPLHGEACASAGNAGGRGGMLSCGAEGAGPTAAGPGVARGHARGSSVSTRLSKSSVLPRGLDVHCCARGSVGRDGW